MPPTNALAIGSLIGDYKTEELCSEGVGYALYRAVHTRLGRPAAIRVNHKTLLESEIAERVQQEAKSFSRIHHPNVAQLYDYGRLDDGRAYIAREWVDGNALTDHRELTQAQLLKLLKQICSGLGAMHGVGLSHGKLDPKAVILEAESGNAKLIELPLDGSASGGSPRADIHSLGALVEELFATRSSVAAGPDEVTPLSPAVDAIIRKCMALATEDGYESVEEVARALERALGEDDEQGLAEGTLISDTYRVCGLIGQGGMGSVYEAVHKRLPQRVAIKVISGQFTEESLARFRQEAEIASSLGHPHIVRVFDFNTLPDGRPYMVMELLEGEDLAKTLGYGPLSQERAILIARQVGSALSAAHDKGIVHRDLKPPNIFLRSVEIGGQRREHAMVLDFGVSKRENAETSITKSEVIIGTPKYMAPEQAVGDNDEVGPHSDQFALACITYEMLSGRRPFGDGTLAEIVYRVCTVDPPALETLVSEIDAGLTAAIARAMSKRARDRFPSMADFIAALSGRPLSSTRVKPGDATVKLKKPAEAEASQPSAETVATVASRPPPKPASEPPQTSEPVDLPKKSHASRVVLALLGLGVLTLVYVAGPWTEDKTQKASLVVASDAREDIEEPAADPKLNPAPVDGESQIPPDAEALVATPIDAGSRVPSGGDDSKKDNRRKPDPKISKKLKAELDAAEKLLRSGRYGETRRALRKNQKAALSNRGIALIVMSYCGENNFGTAQDWFRRVARADKRRVKSYCKSKHGIDLD